MDGIVVGMFGIEGIVVGNGGRVTFGAVGKLGNDGTFGRDGTWVFGKLGNVGCGRLVEAGGVGNWLTGKGGRVSLGCVGKEGSGGNVAWGIVGSVNAGGGATGVSKRWRAAMLIFMLDKHNAIIKDNIILYERVI